MDDDEYDENSDNHHGSIGVDDKTDDDADEEESGEETRAKISKAAKNKFPHPKSISRQSAAQPDDMFSPM